MSTRSVSPARRRVLSTASALFYAEGIHAVGIDRIIAEAAVAKATFYHHFPSKDALVHAYVEEQARTQREAMAQVTETAPRERLLRVFDAMGEIGALPGFRGCQFINVAAEYPERDHPVRQAVDAHRRWFHEEFRSELAAMGDPDPAATASMLMLVRDGIAVGANLDDPADVRAIVRQAVTRLLGPAV
ncbi:TetR/AcrR family transcriptional regulator [Nonomuraea soli]|uniref:AcrR family transcriptional regulator n=1 Tax=Nonomuraea soli TaxID=1032476 RepID=A0A7W0HND5_9ACTN|nr:TetR/AcrR family transcriptional regulator [Nonomuraea soli]MBA2889421.1 AcrR family transcriptional regulator [Nonomuraea soli]